MRSIMKRKSLLSLLILIMASTLAAQAQHYSDDFENGYTWYPPWTNIHLVADSNDVDVQHFCLCDNITEYGLGFSYPIPDELLGKNLHVAFQADYRFPDTTGTAELVFTIRKGETLLFWESHDLATYSNDSAGWFPVHVEMNLPADHLVGGTFNTYLWNTGKATIHVDNASIDLTPWSMPSYLPDIDVRRDSVTAEDLCLQRPGDSLNPLTYAIGLAEEYIVGEDTITEYHPFSLLDEGRYLAISGIDSTFARLIQLEGKAVLLTSSRCYKDCRLLRQAVVVPFVDSTLTVYRRNMSIDSTLLQPEYYLDREGFQVGKGERSVIAYHNLLVSSTQLDATHHTAYFNLDYWRDHPMIHYPLDDSLEDVHEDVSSRPMHASQEWWSHPIVLYVGHEVSHLPRISGLPGGYESGIIFTEHADWTDIRTQRATMFGNEHVTKARNATGGFVYYGIPMTKSVFYNNPDQITNKEASHGKFPGLQATVTTHEDFEKLLKQLDKIGFDICLHTPEQYTTTPSNFEEALNYMQKTFKSTTWIDHGYNNGSRHNREDLVCDALDPQADAYAAKLWQANGIRYLWNPYYEENRMEEWHFDNNILQPYPGFGDALPNRQVTVIAGYDYYEFTYGGSEIDLDPSFLTWSTPSTLDANSDANWDYYYNEKRLQKIVDQRSVHITHVYPAWTNPARAFWTYDADSTIIALPGMNRALARIAALRDKGQMLPMTVRTYLDYYGMLNHVNYEVIDEEHIQIINGNAKDIKDFTLVCPAPIRFEDNRFHQFKKSGNQYYVWFDLRANERVTITIKNE